ATGGGSTVTSSNGRYVTDSRGEIVIPDITGTIVVTETKAAEGYAIDPDHRSETVTISPSDAQTLTFGNPRLLTLTIRKRDAVTHEPLSGAEFYVRESGGAAVGTYITGADGTALVSGLTPGVSLVVAEAYAPDGYTVDPTPRTIQITTGGDNSLTFDNAPTSTLLIRKVIAGTDNEPLEGVQFKVTDSSGAEIGTSGGIYTTDATGEIRIVGIRPGTTVNVRETKTSDGYVLDGDTRSLLIQAGQEHTLLFENQRKGSLIVRKTDSETGEPLAGAGFRITYADGRPVDNATGNTDGGPAVTSSNGNYVTDSRGEIVLNDVTGTITVTETKPPQGYAMDPENRSQTVTITARDAQTLTFGNPKLLTLTVHKRDSVTGAPLSGAEFAVKDSGGETIGSFTTGEDGTVAVPGLTPGATVVVSETKAPTGYVLNDRPQTYRMQTGRDNSVTFENTPTTTLVVRKVIAGTNEPLADVRFHITDSSGAAVGPDGGMFTTDRNGEIRVTGLAPGMTVVVRETRTAEGFVLDGTARELLIRAGEQQTMLFENLRKGSLLVRKLDAATREPLPGAEFTILHADGRPVDNANGHISSAGRYTTDDNGEILISGVLGTLIVTEEKPAPGYVMDPDSRTRTVEVTPNDAQTLVFTNAPKQSLTIRKFVANTTTPIPGTVFLVTDSTGNRLGPDNGEFTTDANGEIVVTGLTPGVTVTAKEIRAAVGFVEDGTPQSIYVRSGDAQSLTFYDTPKQSVTIRKYDRQTNRPLAGVTFLVTDAAGNRVGEYVTDENGEAVVYGLDPGASLVVREIRTVNGYVLNSEPRTLVVGTAGTVSLMGAGGTSGATASGGTSSGTAGGSTVSGNTVSFYDEPLSTLVVKKYEAGTDYAPVSGAEFTITDGNGGAIGNTGGVFRTNSAGTITVEGLEPGTTVKVQETKAPEGFVLDGTPRTITIENSQVHTLEFWNRKCGSLTVKKLDSATRQPIPGAEFKLSYTDGRPVDTASGQQSSAGQYFTDANGEIVVTGVTGSIVITETKPAPGYVMNPDSRSRTVEINPDDAQTITILNTPTQTLTVRKFVAGTTRPVAGAEFLVTDATGAVVGENGGRYVTDADGQFVISGLAPGVTLKVRETKAPEGFVLDGAEKSIVIRAGNAQSLAFTNAPCGSLKIVKRDSVTGQPLAGAEFQVLTSNGQYVPDRGGRLSSNGLYTTDSNGEILITGLDPVTLVVKETRAPEGYALDDTPQTVDVLADETRTLTFRDVPLERVIIRKFEEGTTNPLAGVRFLVTDGGNRPLGAGEYVTDGNGEIAISGIAPGTTVTAREVKTVNGYALNGMPQSLEVKSGEANTLTFYDAPLSVLVVKKYIAGTDHEPLEGVHFRITDGNGKAVGTSGGSFTTDETGTITIPDLEPGTTLKVQETRTVPGFVLDGTPKTITIESSQVHELAFENRRSGSLTVIKQDSATHAPIPGTVFHIAYADGRPVDTANEQQSTNGRYVTDDNGEIRIGGITGTVVVTEEQAAPGYTIRPDGKSQTVEIGPEDGQTLTFLNDPTQTLTVQKFAEGTTTPLPGAVFLISDSGGERLGTEDGRFTTDVN
ncbi:MAG: hypothetical protein J6X53_07985, partial [Abditibacteriota bacterium]|nr:hypothetical protein [Abditibacteriota bacterium]